MRFMVMVMATKESEAGVPPTPEEFAALIHKDIAKWTKVVQAAGIQPE